MERGGTHAWQDSSIYIYMCSSTFFFRVIIYSKYSTSTNLHDTVASSATDWERVCRWPGRQRESGGEVAQPVFPLKRRQQMDTNSHLAEVKVMGAGPVLALRWPMGICGANI